jgi:hypothetical protein
MKNPVSGPGTGPGPAIWLSFPRMPHSARSARIPRKPVSARLMPSTLNALQVPQVLIAFVVLVALPTLAASGLPAVGNAPVSPLIQPAPSLHVRVGPDSNACGITPPAGWEPFAGAGKAASKASAKRPLLIWLHGGMRSRNTEKGFEAHRALIPFVPPKAYWIASPSAYLDNEWTRPQGLAHIDALIGYMAARYPVDTSAITLFGVSDGCLGVIAYSLQGKRAEKVVRRILVSSAPQLVLDAQALPGQKLFSGGSWDFLQGGRDQLFPPDQVVPYLRRWEGLYPNAHLHYFPDGEHDFGYYVLNAPDLLKALLIPQKGRKH